MFGDRGFDESLDGVRRGFSGGVLMVFQAVVGGGRERDADFKFRTLDEFFHRPRQGDPLRGGEPAQAGA